MIVLIGAGGHARVILDILEQSNKKVAGLLDDNPGNAEVCGFPVLGPLSKLPDLSKQNPELEVIIAIGSNETREKIASHCEDLGVDFGLAIHPTAVIGSNVSIGQGTVIMANAVINHSAALGKHNIINTSASVDHDCMLGDFVHISPGVNLAGSVKIGTGTHVGVGACVIPGVTIGERTVIGAGSAVIRDVANHVVAVGSPAKQVKNREK